MKRFSKKILAALLTMALLFCLIPLAVSAKTSLDDPVVVQAGKEYNTADYIRDTEETGYVWFIVKLDSTKNYTLEITKGNTDAALYPDRGTGSFDWGYSDGDSIDYGDYKRVMIAKNDGDFSFIIKEAGVKEDVTEESTHTEHTWETLPTVDSEPTCTTAGVQSIHCTGCDARKDIAQIPAKGHTWGSSVGGKDATCTTAGNTGVRSCTVCGKTQYNEEIPALGHDYVYGKCSRCGVLQAGVEGARNRVFAADSVLRVYGSTRYGTSIAVADKLKLANGLDQFETVVVASGNNYPDALTGSYLACLKSAPILLVGNSDSETAILNYIKSNLSSTGTIYVLGGDSAVSNSYVSKLKSIRDNVKVLSGTTRFDTNLQILEEAGIQGTELLVSEGGSNTSFADAVSVSSTGKPLMIVDKGTADKQGVYNGKLTEAQKAYLTSAKNKGTIQTITVLGGTSAVPTSLYNELVSIFGASNVTRVGGATRYETSRLIAEKYVPLAYGITLAWGGNYPDALCGGPLAYAIGAPVLLTDASDKNAASYANTMFDYRVIGFGGAGENNTQLTDSSITAVKSGTIKAYYIAQ